MIHLRKSRRLSTMAAPHIRIYVRDDNGAVEFLRSRVLTGDWVGKKGALRRRTGRPLSGYTIRMVLHLRHLNV